MKVKIKKLFEDVIIPKYAKEGDAGLDLVATGAYYEEETKCIVYTTGIAIEIPKGYVGLIFPRSSISKYNLQLTNCVGVIDSGYRGEIVAKFKLLPSYVKVHKEGLNIEKGIIPVYLNKRDYYDFIITNLKVYKLKDRICQLIIIPYPNIELIESETLLDSERGTGGFGSTGN
jgi:dUTP pyrophosphatase